MNESADSRVRRVGRLNLGKQRVDVAREHERAAVEGRRIGRRHLPDAGDGAGIAGRRRAEFPARPVGRRETGVVGKAGVDRLAVARRHAGEEAADGGFLRRRQAGAVARRAAGRDVAVEIERRLTGLRVLHHAVARAVERVAAREHRTRDQLALGQREAGRGIGRVGGKRRIRLAAGEVGDRGARQHRARIADEKAVVLVGKPRRRDQRVPAAVRAAADVGAVGRLAVGGANHLLGHRRELRDRAVAVVEARLRVDAEAAVLRAAVAGVRADHGEALRERVLQGRPRADRAGGGDDVAVDAAIGLVEEAPVPRLGQTHLEADRVALAVDRTGALVHAAGHAAMRGDRLAGDAELARADGRGAERGPRV